MKCCGGVEEKEEKNRGKEEAVDGDGGEEKRGSGL